MYKINRDNKEVNVLKNLVDFDDVYLDKKMNYHLYGLNQTLKVGDEIYIDLAMDKDSTTLILAQVIKSLKNEIIIKYEYCDNNRNKIGGIKL